MTDLCVGFWGWMFELSWKTEFPFPDDVKSQENRVKKSIFTWKFDIIWTQLWIKIINNLTYDRKPQNIDMNI